MNKLLIIVLDGCSLEYISNENMPNLYKIAKDGFSKYVKAAIPTVTNVNHATILTGKFPCDHGVVGNYYYNRESGEQGFIENTGFINTETIIDYLYKKGASTAFLAVKENVLEVFGRNVKFGLSVEKPNEILVRYLDMSTPPSTGSLEANSWIMEACYRIIKKNNPDVVYCTTNDYMMHNYEPGTKKAMEQMHEIDKWIGKIYDLDPTREIYITADHAMNKKTTIVNLQRVMDRMGYEVVCHPPIKDKYIENHPYQEGGVIYLFLKNENDQKTEEMISFLEDSPYIDMVCTKEEANRKFNLPVDKIGDYIVLAADGCAFGDIQDEELITENVRTHGSLQEREIPLIAVNAKEVPEKYRYSRDIVKILME